MSKRPFEPKLATRYRVLSEPQRTGTLPVSSQLAVQLPVDRFSERSRAMRSVSRMAGRRFLPSDVRNGLALSMLSDTPGVVEPYLQISYGSAMTGPLNGLQGPQ